jgi:hypothetical protein
MKMAKPVMRFGLLARGRGSNLPSGPRFSHDLSLGTATFFGFLTLAGFGGDVKRVVDVLTARGLVPAVVEADLAKWGRRTLALARGAIGAAALEYATAETCRLIGNSVRKSAFEADMLGCVCPLSHANNRNPQSWMVQYRIDKRMDRPYTNDQDIAHRARLHYRGQ